MAIVTLDQIRDVFLTWGTNITGRVAFLASLSEDGKPATPYFTVYLAGMQPSTPQNVELSVDGLTETINSLDIMRLTINTIGGEAMQDASRLLRSLFSSQRFLDLWTICGYTSVTEATDLSFLETGTMRQRAQFTINIQARVGDTFVVSSFDALDLTITANGDDQKVVNRVCVP